MQISQFSLTLAEDYRAAKDAFLALNAETPAAERDAAWQRYESTASALAASVLGDIDRANITATGVTK